MSFTSVRYVLTALLLCVAGFAAASLAGPAAPAAASSTLSPAQKKPGAGYSWNRSTRTRRAARRKVNMWMYYAERDRVVRGVLRQQQARQALQNDQFVDDMTKRSVTRGLHWTRQLSGIAPDFSQLRRYRAGSLVNPATLGRVGLGGAAFSLGFVVVAPGVRELIRPYFPPGLLGPAGPQDAFSVGREYFDPIRKGSSACGLTSQSGPSPSLWTTSTCPFDGFRWTWTRIDRWGQQIRNETLDGCPDWPAPPSRQGPYGQTGYFLYGSSGWGQPPNQNTADCRDSQGAPISGVVYTGLIVPLPAALSGGSRPAHPGDDTDLTADVGDGHGGFEAPLLPHPGDEVLDERIGNVLDGVSAEEAPAGTTVAQLEAINADIGAWKRCEDYLMGDPSIPAPVIGAKDPCGDTQGGSIPDALSDETLPVQRPEPIDPGGVDDPVIDEGREEVPVEQPWSEPLPEEVQPRVALPDCEADLVAACRARLAAAGFANVAVTTLSFDQAELTKPANAVVEIDPAPGTVLSVASKIALTANPDEDVMPLLARAPTAHEQADDYLNALRQAGIQTRTRDQDPWDEEFGPGEVTNAEPTGRIARTRVVTVTQQRDDDCDFGTRTEPWLTLDMGDPFDPFDMIPAQPAEFDTTEGPTKLLWGTAASSEGENWVGWGYRKIAAKHGWSAFDDAQTRNTLRTASSVSGERPEYRLFRGLSTYPSRLDRWQCRRHVVVAFGPVDDETQPRGIITSYGARVSGG